MRKILVLRGGALGDFIVTLPALAALRRLWPAARIELAGNAAAATLARDAGLLDAVHSQHEGRWSTLFGDTPLPAEFAAWLASFELVLNFWPDAGGEIARHFPHRTGQRFLSGPAHPTLAPAAAHFCEPLRALGLETRDYFFRLAESRISENAPVAVHPGSGSPRKNWPLAHWRELAEWLEREHGAKLLVITGETDLTAARALAGIGEAAHQLPLDHLVNRLARCRLFVGHDSGISHLAAACDVPSVLLFGPSDPAIWAPPAPHVRVIQRGVTLDSLSLSDVQRELAPLLAVAG